MSPYIIAIFLSAKGWPIMCQYKLYKFALLQLLAIFQHSCLPVIVSVGVSKLNGWDATVFYEAKDSKMIDRRQQRRKLVERPVLASEQKGNLNFY